MTAHFGHIGVSQRPHARPVSTLGCRAHRMGPATGVLTERGRCALAPERHAPRRGRGASARVLSGAEYRRALFAAGRPARDNRSLTELYGGTLKPARGKS